MARWLERRWSFTGSQVATLRVEADLLSDKEEDLHVLAENLTEPSGTDRPLSEELTEAVRDELGEAFLVLDWRFEYSSITLVVLVGAYTAYQVIAQYPAFEDGLARLAKRLSSILGRRLRSQNAQAETITTHVLPAPARIAPQFMSPALPNWAHLYLAVSNALLFVLLVLLIFIKL